LDNVPVKKALVLNCGNGWVERDLIDGGICEEAVAFDISEELLSQAEELRGDRQIEYIRCDCNKIEFPNNSFDLVANVAAMHHVQYINRMHKVLCAALREDGYFVNFDYVGPHRNQYSEQHFSLLKKINESLPDGFASEPFARPNVVGMLKEDPTEAIHSGLIAETFERYFIPLERKYLGGGIAYPIMHNNRELYWKGNKVAEHIVEFLLQVDELASKMGVVPSLFAFFVGKPRKEIFDPRNAELLEKYRIEEEERERKAELDGGRYYEEENASELLTLE
jgi:SAM-dependent methyltransferase